MNTILEFEAIGDLLLQVHGFVHQVLQLEVKIIDFQFLLQPRGREGEEGWRGEEERGREERESGERGLSCAMLIYMHICSQVHNSVTPCRHKIVQQKFTSHLTFTNSWLISTIINIMSRPHVLAPRESARVHPWSIGERDGSASSTPRRAPFPCASQPLCPPGNRDGCGCNNNKRGGCGFNYKC